MGRALGDIDELDSPETNLVSLNTRICSMTRIYEHSDASMASASSTGSGDATVRDYDHHLLLASLYAWKQRVVWTEARRCGHLSTDDRLTNDISYLNEIHLSIVVAKTFGTIHWPASSNGYPPTRFGTLMELAKRLLRPVDRLRERTRYASFIEDIYHLQGALHLFQFPVGATQPLFYAAVHARSRSLRH